MTAYKIYVTNHLEARNAADASQALIEQNGDGKRFYFSDVDSFWAKYNDLKKDLHLPYELSHGLRWYSGIVGEKADAEGNTPEEIFENALCADVVDSDIKIAYIVRINADGKHDFDALRREYSTETGYSVTDLNQMIDEWNEEDESDGYRYELQETTI